MAKAVTTTTALNTWDAELEKHATVAAKAESQQTSSGNFFSTKGGQLSFDGSPLPGNQIDAIILATCAENAYYEGKFNPGQPASPVCFAFSDEDGNMAPHPQSSKPQHTSCLGCPHNEFGTADGGAGAGKACKNLRRLALVPAGKVDGDKFLFNSSDTVKAAAIGYLKVPPTSNKEFSRYTKTLATVLKRPPFGVATRVGLTPAGTTFKIEFLTLDKAPVELRDAIMAQREIALNDIKAPYTPTTAQEDAKPKTKGRSLR